MPSISRGLAVVAVLLPALLCHPLAVRLQRRLHQAGWQAQGRGCAGVAPRGPAHPPYVQVGLGV